MNKAIVFFTFLIFSHMVKSQGILPWRGHEEFSTAWTNPFPHLGDLDQETSVINRNSSNTPWYFANGSTITEIVLTFSPFFENGLIDSFWQEYRNISASTDTLHYQTSSHIIHCNVTEKNQLFLTKVIYGDSFDFVEEKRYIVTDTASHTQTAEIIYKGRSSKDQGILDLTFKIEKDRSIVFKKLFFLPFDHSQNAFLRNLSESDIASLRNKNSSVFIDTALCYSDDNITLGGKKLKKQLENLNISSNTLFTSRLFIKNKTIWVVGIYDTDKKDEHLMLGYKLINKKFKPAYIEVKKKDPLQ